MRNVLDCINAFIPLLSTEYELVLGRKGVSVTLRISFDKKDCFYLMLEEIIISAVHFFRRKRWIIRKIKHRGHFFIRKRLIYQPE